MDNYSIALVIIVFIIFVIECIFSKNRKDLIMSVISLFKAIFKLLTVPVFQIILLYEFIIIITILCCFKIHGYSMLKFVYSYLSFVSLLIIPETTKITFNTKIYRLVTPKVIKKFTITSLFIFFIKAFEPNLLLSSLVVVFFVLKSLVEIFSHKKEAFPRVTEFIGFILIYYSISMFIDKLSYSLLQKLLTSFILPILFWLVNIPLLMLLKYLMELDRTVNWIRCRYKLLLIFSILIMRIYWLIRLHNKFSEINVKIVSIKLG